MLPGVQYYTGSHQTEKEIWKVKFLGQIPIPESLVLTIKFLDIVVHFDKMWVNMFLKIYFSKRFFPESSRENATLERAQFFANTHKKIFGFFGVINLDDYLWTYSF